MTASPELLSTFPFPFSADHYRYSTNLEPAGTAVSTAVGRWGDRTVDVDGEYEAELAERASILAADPTRYAVLPHMRPACWDAMLTLMRELASAHPLVMSLTGDGTSWHWRNARLGLAQDFVFGDESTLPTEPLAYIAGQLQDDIVLLDQRAGDLFADAGVVTFAAGWSFGFDVGMTFLEIHGPVPRLRESGVITRARDFLMRLQPNEAFRRTNWSMNIGHRLDVSTETYPVWVGDQLMLAGVDDETFGRLLHLRVEVQHLIRLSESGAICFLIRTYMLPLSDLVVVEPWRLRTAAVLAELPDDLRYYGGKLMDRLHDAACAEHCDWQMLRELKRDGAGALLPDVQWMRMLAQVLKVRCRGEIKAGDFPAAIRTVQTMLALARSFNEHPTLIGQLVGCAIAAIGLGCVEEMIQQPGCPNLYWALSDLPAPFIDINKGLKGDRVVYASVFADFPRGGTTWTSEQEARAFARLPKLFEVLDPKPPQVKKAGQFAPYIAQLGNDEEFQKLCSGWLREAGYGDGDITGMTPPQRVIVGSVERVEALRDETAKWMRRPYAELSDEMKAAVASGPVAAQDVTKHGVFGGTQVFIMKVKIAQTRTDSIIAQLRTVEAIRLQAAATGKAPVRISDAGTPAPIDPFSGKPFDYHVEDDGKLAVFSLTPPVGLEKAAPYNLRWKISLRAK